MEIPHAILDHIDHFFGLVAAHQIEIYNEFSLQHELGFHLRDRLRAEGTKVQFERPVSFFSLPGKFEKKEIDLTLIGASGQCSIAIELKFPRTGQYPEQMFKACQDIFFLEQLVDAGFAAGFFVMAADHPLFYRQAEATGIYRFFRGCMPITGPILGPTGDRQRLITVTGSYRVDWRKVTDAIYYHVIEIREKDREGKDFPCAPTSCGATHSNGETP
jgi:hypothetical protein